MNWRRLGGALAVIAAAAMPQANGQTHLLDARTQTGRYLVYGPNPFAASNQTMTMAQWSAFKQTVAQGVPAAADAYFSFVSLAAIPTQETLFASTNANLARVLSWPMAGDGIAFLDTMAGPTKQALAMTVPLWETDRLWNRTSTLAAWLSAPHNAVQLCHGDKHAAEIVYVHGAPGDDPLVLGVGLLGLYALRFVASPANVTLPLANNSAIYTAAVALGPKGPSAPVMDSLRWTHAYCKLSVDAGDAGGLPWYLPAGSSTAGLSETTVGSIGLAGAHPPAALGGVAATGDSDANLGWGDSDAGAPWVEDDVLRSLFRPLLPQCPGMSDDVSTPGTDGTRAPGKAPTFVSLVCFFLFVGATLLWAWNNATVEKLKMQAEADRLLEASTAESAPSPGRGASGESSADSPEHSAESESESPAVPHDTVVQLYRPEP